MRLIGSSCCVLYCVKRAGIEIQLMLCREYTANTQTDCVIMQLECDAMHRKDSGKNMIGLHDGHTHRINWSYTINYLINFILIHIRVSE